MRKMILLAVGAVILLVWCGRGWAKWYKVCTSKSGTWYVSDTKLKRDGECKLFTAGVVYKQLKQTPHGKAAVKHYHVRVCCRAGTLQYLAYRYLNSQRKIIFMKEKIGRPLKPRPGTVRYEIFNKTCSPSFGMR